jgi:hypothetical protein
LIVDAVYKEIVACESRVLSNVLQQYVDTLAKVTDEWRASELGLAVSQAVAECGYPDVRMLEPSTLAETMLKRQALAQSWDQWNGIGVGSFRGGLPAALASEHNDTIRSLLSNGNFFASAVCVFSKVCEGCAILDVHERVAPMLAERARLLVDEGSVENDDLEVIQDIAMSIIEVHVRKTVSTAVVATLHSGTDYRNHDGIQSDGEELNPLCDISNSVGRATASQGTWRLWMSRAAARIISTPPHVQRHGLSQTHSSSHSFKITTSMLVLLLVS